MIDKATDEPIDNGSILAHVNELVEGMQARYPDDPKIACTVLANTLGAMVVAWQRADAEANTLRGLLRTYHDMVDAGREVLLDIVDKYKLDMG